MKVYLDNAATTALDPKVVDAMIPYFTGFYGNPSSIHSFGRETRSAIEKSRKMVADLLNTSPSQIFFNSGATEGNNTILFGAIHKYQIKHAITSKIEHHAVLHPLEYLHQAKLIELHYVDLDPKGQIVLESLKKLLQTYPNALVALMHGNNELGNISDVHEIRSICTQYGALFHSDSVQTIGHQKLDLKSNSPDFVVASAHKFHGPKGVGLMFAGDQVKISPYLHGGAQERNVRGGTENVAGIIGLATALELCYSSLNENEQHLKSLKSHFIKRLHESGIAIGFNGDCENLLQSLPHVVSVSFPVTDMADMLLFNLDIQKIAVSGGSACNSGANVGSHVLNALYGDSLRPSVRFSFSKFTKIDELDRVIEVLQKLYS